MVIYEVLLLSVRTLLTLFSVFQEHFSVFVPDVHTDLSLNQYYCVISVTVHILMFVDYCMHAVYCHTDNIACILKDIV